jgi:AcrR family transcriptional regulator
VPTPRKLDRDTIVVVALKLANAHGIEQLSLRKVANAFGVTPMALYRHVAGKEGLLAAMADRLYAELDLPHTSQGWWADLAALARSTRKLALAHPAAPELLSRFGTVPHAERITKSIAACMEEGGIPRREVAELHEQLAALVFALTAISPSNAAFERGLELIGAGLRARATTQRPPARRQRRRHRAAP